MVIMVSAGSSVSVAGFGGRPNTNAVADSDGNVLKLAVTALTLNAYVCPATRSGTVVEVSLLPVSSIAITQSASPSFVSIM